MKQRWIFGKHTETIVVLQDRPRRSLWRQICGFFFKVGLTLFASLIPIYFFLLPAIHGFTTGEFKLYRRRNPSPKMLYGEEAITESWLHLGMAFVCFTLFWWTMRNEIKSNCLNWLLLLVLGSTTIACLSVGIYRLVTGS